MKRFVVHKHTQEGQTHWDLMLEWGDVLKTWRINAPPEEFCIGPISAEKIFDHDKKFLTYQGTVNNGTGTVEPVDSGTLQVTSQKDYRIEFILNGNIVMGKFCLDYFDKKWRFANIEIFEYVENDDAIFHYTKLSVAIKNILSEKKLKPSVLKNTDDPREYNFNSASMGIWGAPLGDPNKLSTKAVSVIKILKSKCKLFCFCSNKQPSLILKDGDIVEDTYNISKGYAKPRMWSQYGEKHCGICLIFSKKVLEQQLEKFSDIVYRCDHIEYSQKAMDVRAITYDGDNLEKLTQEECAKMHFTKHSKEIFHTKHIDYRDEAEYRAVVFDDKETFDYLDIATSIKGVILGDKTPDLYIPTIEQLCKQLKIACRKVFWDGGVASLVYHKIV